MALPRTLFVNACLLVYYYTQSKLLVSNTLHAQTVKKERKKFLKSTPWENFHIQVYFWDLFWEVFSKYFDYLQSKQLYTKWLSISFSISLHAILI